MLSHTEFSRCSRIAHLDPPPPSSLAKERTPLLPPPPWGGSAIPTLATNLFRPARRQERRVIPEHQIDRFIGIIGDREGVEISGRDRFPTECGTSQPFHQPSPVL